MDTQVFDFALAPEDVHCLDNLNENARTINPPWMKGEWEQDLSAGNSG